MTTFKRASLLLATLIAGVVFQTLHAAEPQPDWWKTQREVVEVLMKPGATLAAVAKQAGQAKPTGGQQALFNFCVFTRAGMTKESIETLRDLKRFCPGHGELARTIYYDACDHLKAWELAQATVEVFADDVTDLSLDNRLLKHMLESGQSLEQVDAWLADKPKGIDNYWVRERLRFNKQHGRAAALEKQLADRVRANPADIAGAMTFLDAMVYADHSPQARPDLAWFAELIKPKRATDARHMATCLTQLHAPQAALFFFRQAVAIPLTAEDVQLLSRNMQVAMPNPDFLRAMYDAQTRDSLAECLLQLDQSGEAQKWMLEAAEIRKKHNLGRNTLFAGRVQAESGARDIESQIKAEEKQSADDPKYWQQRAHYYRGRKEAQQEEAALKKALALTAPRPTPQHKGKGYVDMRTSCLADYALFLNRAKRDGEAVTLLRKELAEAPADSESSKQAARLLAFDFSNHLRTSDPVLWTWLEKRPLWEHNEERLLWRMLERAKPDEQEEYLTQAEKLAFDGDPTRAAILGWVENRMEFPQRSVPLLEHAIQKGQDAELKQRAAFTLFESYLDIGDWKRAEAVFPQASRRLSGKEAPEWYGRVALAAAQAGDKADALRLWKGVLNIDLSAMDKLDQLARAGLTDELIELYRDVQKAIPSSDIPAKAIERLQNLPPAGEAPVGGGNRTQDRRARG